jgi:hypothetical protein
MARGRSQSSYVPASPSAQGRARTSAYRGDPLPIPPGPHRRAGRKRSLSRRMRSFESAMSRLDIPGRVSGGKHWLAALHRDARVLSKALSALILAGAIAALVSIHNDEEWFIYSEDVYFENLAYLDAPALFAQLQVDGWNILWLQPQELRSRLLAHAGIIDAHVRLQLPGRVEISFTERQPVALWVTGQGVYRLADNGATLSGPLSTEAVVASPADRALPQIIDPLQEAQRPGLADTVAMDPDVLTGALAVADALPELQNRVRYNRGVGLNFPLPDGDGWVYWGDAHHLDEKVTNLAAARQYISENNVESRIVDVRFLNRPFLR